MTIHNVNVEVTLVSCLREEWLHIMACKCDSLIGF